MQLWHLIQLKDDCFDFFAAHDRSNGASCGQSRRAQVNITERNASEQSLVFTNRSTQCKADFFPIVLVELCSRFEITHTKISVSRIKTDGVIFSDVNDGPIFTRTVEG